MILCPLLEQYKKAERQKFVFRLNFKLKYYCLSALILACAAASLAIGTRKGEHET